jgi:hypothetical protein
MDQTSYPHPSEKSFLHISEKQFDQACWHEVQKRIPSCTWDQSNSPRMLSWKDREDELLQPFRQQQFAKTRLIKFEKGAQPRERHAHLTLIQADGEPLITLMNLEQEVWVAPKIGQSVKFGGPEKFGGAVEFHFSCICVMSW